ncbi:hypothetical protein OG749_08880 [Streptomyces nojiriensis]|uniref:WD40 repeat domain-containing protein n=1 Tax=Streptomyces nojiriensis TaxID=66374 RepID=UPI002E18A0DE
MSGTDHDPSTASAGRPGGPLAAASDPAAAYRYFAELTGTRRDTGADRTWLGLLADTLREAPAELPALLAPGSDARRAFARDLRALPGDDPLADERSPAADTAEVLLALAVALAGPDAGRAERAVSEAARHWRARGVLASGTREGDGTARSRWFRGRRERDTGLGPDGGPAWSPPGAEVVREAVDGLTDRAAAAFVGLVVRELSGLAIGPAKRTRRLRGRRAESVCRVLIARGDSGSRAELRLRQLPSGPAGLHPDPALMSFLISHDDRLSQSLSAAWQASGAAGRGGCVLWSVTETTPDGSGVAPCSELSGGSLGGAFGIALLDLSAGRRRLRSRLPRRLRQDTAVSAGIGAEGELRPVGKLGPKLAAAAPGSLVVLPQANTSEARAATAGSAVLTVFAGNLDQAYRASHRLDGRLIAASVAAIALVAASVFGVYAARTSRESDREKALADSRTLATRSVETGDSDPRRRAVLAAAALGTSDTPEARGAARSALTSQARALLMGVGSWVGFTPDGNGLLAVDHQRNAVTWDPHSMLRVGPVFEASLADVVQGAITQKIDVSPDRRTLASDDERGQVWLWDMTGKTNRRGPLPAGSGLLNALAFSPDGRLLATVEGTYNMDRMTEDRTEVVLWDVASGERLRTIRTDHTSPVSTLAFGPDGTTLATVAGKALWPGATDDFRVRVWSVADGRGVGPAMTGMSSPGRVLAFSPDGSMLAAGADDGTIRTWWTAGGGPVGNPFGAHEGGVSALAWSPRSDWVASAGAESTEVRLWNPGGPDSGLVLKGHRGVVAALAWSPDGRVLASGAPVEDGTRSFGEQGAVRLWELDNAMGPGVPFVAGPGTLPGVLAYAPDGAAVATGGWDGAVRLDAVPARSLVPDDVLPRMPGGVSGLVFSAAGKELAVAGADGSVHQYSLSPRRELWSWRGPTPLTSLAHAAGAPVLAAGARSGEVYVWHGADASGAAAPRTLSGHTGAVTATALLPSGTAAFSAGLDGTVRLWDTSSGRQSWSAGLTDPRRPGDRSAVAATSLAVDAKGRRLAVGGSDGAVRIWALGDGGVPAQAEPRYLYGPLAAITSAAWQGSDGALAVGDRAGVLAVWNTGTGAVAQIVQAGADTDGSEAVTALAYSADGARLLSMTADLGASLRRADDIAETDVHFSAGGGSGHAFLSPQSPAGTVVSVSRSAEKFVQSKDTEPEPSRQSVRVWDGPGRTLIRSFTLVDGASPVGEVSDTLVDGIAFRVAAGPTLGSGTLTLVHGKDLLARFDLVTGRQTGTVRLLPPRGQEPLNTLQAAVFSPKGDRVAVVAENRLTVHDTATGRALMSATLARTPTALAFSPDGGLLAVAGQLERVEPTQYGRLGLWRVADGGRLSASDVFSADMSGPGTVDGGAVAFSGDGRTLAVTTGRGVRLLGLADPRHPVVRDAYTADMSAGATALEFSADGAVLAVVVDRGVTLFATDDGATLTKFPHEIGGSWAGVGFTADGTRLISASAASVIRSWDVSRWRDPAAARLCERIGGPVTRADWNALVPARFPFRKLCA